MREPVSIFRSYVKLPGIWYYHGGFWRRNCCGTVRFGLKIHWLIIRIPCKLPFVGYTFTLGSDTPILYIYILIDLQITPFDQYWFLVLGERRKTLGILGTFNLSGSVILLEKRAWSQVGSENRIAPKLMVYHHVWHIWGILFSDHILGNHQKWLILMFEHRIPKS